MLLGCNPHEGLGRSCVFCLSKQFPRYQQNMLQIFFIFFFPSPWTLPREGPGSPAQPPERAGSKARRDSPAATPGLGKSSPHWGWASSPKLSEGEKPGQEVGNRKRRRQAKPKADLRWRTCRVGDEGAGVSANHRALGEGLGKPSTSPWSGPKAP